MKLVNLWKAWRVQRATRTLAAAGYAVCRIEERDGVHYLVTNKGVYLRLGTAADLNLLTRKVRAA